MKNNELDIVHDHLLQLVNAMTMSEKRYFAANFLNDSHIKIRPIYEEITKSLKKGQKTPALAGLEQTKHYTQAKKYLYDLVLRSLRHFNESNSVHGQLNNAIHEIDILINKELFQIAQKKIRLAKKMANKYDAHMHLITLNSLESRVNTFYNKDKADAIQLQLTNDTIATLRDAITETEFAQLFLEFRTRFFKDRTMDVKALIQDEFAHLSMDVAQMSLRSKYYYYLLMGNHFVVKKDYKQSIEELSKLIELMESDTAVRNNNNLDVITFFNYSVVLNNLIRAVARYDTQERFFFYLEKLKSLKSKSQRQNNKVMLNALILESDYYLSKDMLAEGKTFAMASYGLLNELEADPDRIEIAYYNIAALLFYGGEYRLAARLALRNIEAKPFFNILYRTTLFIYILCQYELDKLQHGFYYIERFPKLLYRDKLTPFDKKLKLVLTNLFLGKNKLVRRHYNHLKEMLEDESFRNNPNINLNQYFNFTGWLDSRI